jgi:hypothetical protein
MPKVTYDNIEFDSTEEMHFYWWVKELKEAGYVNSYLPHPKPIVLSPEIRLEYTKPMKRVEDKILSHSILRGHEYTYDGLIQWNDKAKNIFHNNLDEANHAWTKDRFDKLISNYDLCKIEVKPMYDQNNMTRLAVINQKWVFEKTGYFINIVKPEKLFAKTFTPDRYRYTDKSKQARKIKFKTRTLQEFESLFSEQTKLI